MNAKLSSLNESRSQQPKNFPVMVLTTTEFPSLNESRSRYKQNFIKKRNKLGLSCAKLRAQLSSDLSLSLKLARLRAQLR